MSKRTRQLEKEALEQGLTPTDQLEVDESGLTEEEKGHCTIPLTALIICGVLFLVVVGLLVTLLIL